MDNSEFLTESQTLAYAGIDRNILTRFCETGYIKTKMLANGQVLYNKSEIERVFGKRREVLANYKSKQSVNQVRNQPITNQLQNSVENSIQSQMAANSEVTYGGVVTNTYVNETLSDNFKNNTATYDTTRYTESVNTHEQEANYSAFSDPQNSSSRLIKFPETGRQVQGFSTNYVGSQDFDFLNQIPNQKSSNLNSKSDVNGNNNSEFVNPMFQSAAVNFEKQQLQPIEQQVQQHVSLTRNEATTATKSDTGKFRENLGNEPQEKQNLSNVNKQASNPNGHHVQHSVNSEQVKKLEAEVENLKQEIVKLQSYARLQKKLLEVKEKEISELKQEKDWLKNRIESQEEKNNRDQLLILSETRVIHNLIAGNQKSSPFRAALEWFGFAKKSRTETIDMVKQD